MSCLKWRHLKLSISHRSIVKRHSLPLELIFCDKTPQGLLPADIEQHNLPPVAPPAAQAISIAHVQNLLFLAPPLQQQVRRPDNPGIVQPQNTSKCGCVIC